MSASNSYSNNVDRRALLPLARNSLRKLRTLRHPSILKFLDGTETDTAVWIITEHVRSLAVALNERGGGLSEESKIYGLLHLVTALSFLTRDGGCIHGNVRNEAIWITSGGEWKLGGMEVCTKKDDEAGILWVSAFIRWLVAIGDFSLIMSPFISVVWRITTRFKNLCKSRGAERRLDCS